MTRRTPLEQHELRHQKWLATPAGREWRAKRDFQAWLEKFTDAREERKKFVERFESLVEDGTLDRSRLPDLDSDNGEIRDQFASDLHESLDVRLDADQPSVQVIVHAGTLTDLTVTVKRERVA